MGNILLNSFAPCAVFRISSNTCRAGSQFHAAHAKQLLPSLFCCPLLCWHLLFLSPLHSCHRSAWPCHPHHRLQSHRCPLWFVELLGFSLGRVWLKHKDFAQDQCPVHTGSTSAHSERLLIVICQAAAPLRASMCHYWNTTVSTEMVLGTIQHTQFRGGPSLVPHSKAAPSERPDHLLSHLRTCWGKQRYPKQ